jgi:acetolactate synthase-1/2/3 large subunit
MAMARDAGDYRRVGSRRIDRFPPYDHRNAARTGGELVVASLLAQGVTHAFGVPGESYLAVLDALHDAAERLRFIVCRHEGGAAYMAEAFGKLTGRPGVAFVTRGPGASNAAVGIHTAAQDSTPLVMFVGQVGTDALDREAFQEVDYRRMYGSIVKWAAQIDRVERIPEYVAQAFRRAMAGRPGPVVLALPEDVLAARADVADPPRIEAVAIAPAARRRAARASCWPPRTRRCASWADGAGTTARVRAARLSDATGLPVACALSPSGPVRQPSSALRRRRRHRHQPEARARVATPTCCSSSASAWAR